MIIFWSVVFGLVSMLAYSLANVYSQPLVRKLGSAQVLYLRGLIVCVALAVPAALNYQHFDNLPQICLALVLGIAGYVPVLAFMHGLRVSRVGIVAPIAATSALVTVILAAIIFHVSLDGVQWLAIVMVVAANVAISVDPHDLRNSNVMQLESGVLYALIAAAGWGIFYLVLIYPTRELGPWVSAFLVEVGVTAAAGLHLLSTKQKVTHGSLLTWTVTGSGLGVAVATAAYTIGVYSYNVGIVAVLSNSTALASAVLAAYILKERLSRFEKVVAAFMIIGVILVSIP